MSMSMPRNVYYLKGYTLIYVATGLVFLVLLALEVPGIGRSLLKAVPMSTLAVLVLRQMNGLPRVTLAGALIGSACGDFLLDLPGDDFFVFGLAAFLAGHLFYTGLFFRYAHRPDGVGVTVIAGLVVFAGFMMWLFRQIDPGLYPPVVLYIAVIVAMSIGAYLVPADSRLLFLGALLFILSDVVLAVNKFLVAIPHGRLVNISLYFLAQYLIIVAARSLWGRRVAR